MQLNKFQENFKHIILEPDSLDAENGAFRDMCKQDHGICLENRMKVYRNNVIRSLTEALMSALPMTKKLVGEEFLGQAARAFVLQNLPREGNLNLYGMNFPDFIKTYEPAQNLPYLHDFTRLECLWESAYYAKDDLPLDPATLIDLSEDDLPHLRFDFRDSFLLMESEHPLDQIVDFCRFEDQEDMQKLEKRGCKLIIYRPDVKVELRRVDEIEYAFLKSLQNKHTIHEVASDLSEIYPDADLTQLLQKYLGLDVFSAFSITKQNSSD